MAPAAGLDGERVRLSIRMVLDWYLRRLTAERFANRGPATVPAELSGWVLAGPGAIDAEADGTRPLGAVRQRIEELVVVAGLGRQERIAVTGTFGLREYPLIAAQRPLALRVPRRRSREAPTGAESALRPRQIRAITATAIARLDCALTLGGGDHATEEGVACSPMPEPADAPWFRRRVAPSERLARLLVAIDDARIFVAASGAEGPAADRMLGEIDRYQRALEDRRPGASRPLGRSPARAVISLCLWDLLATPPGLPASLAPSLGLLHPPDGFHIAHASVAALLAGDRSDEMLLAACAHARALDDSDRPGARIVADLLLGALALESRRPSDAAAAEIVRTAVRLRSSDEDPTVLALARYASQRWPRSWRTIDALQGAVPVASALGRFDVADVFCHEVDRTLRTPFAVPGGRDRRTESVEYALWNAHQRSGTLRRRVEAGAPLLVLEQARRLNVEAASRLEWLLGSAAGSLAPGDATAGWAFHLIVRGAELAMMAAAIDPTGASRAPTMVARARAVAREEGVTGRALVPLIKLDLLLALGVRDYGAAVAHLWRLHELGWPLRRTVGGIAALVDSPGARERAPASLAEPVLAIATMEAGAAWPRAVDDANRRRRARLADHRAIAGCAGAIW